MRLKFPYSIHVCSFTIFVHVNLISKFSILKWHMQRFTKKIVDMMKSEGLFESQGGPIILSQVSKTVHFLFVLLFD